MRPHLGPIVVALLAGWIPAATAAAAAPRPNIVHIFADDLGWGSVGFNGQQAISTPNLDALAAGGMRLANAYSAPVCAPSRAMLYTGFHAGHAVIDGNDALTASDSFRAEDVMTGQVLSAAGYSTGVFGKWGFGSTQGSASTQPVVNAPNSLPTNHGFDEFYGYLEHGAAHDYYFRWMWESNAAAPEGVSIIQNGGAGGVGAQYTHDLIATRAQNFVTNHAGDAEPFYLQVNYTIPHADIDDIATAPGGYGIYANMPWTNEQKGYAAMITRMDASIGALISRLNNPNGDASTADSVLANTLVIFTSDNGGDRGTVAQPRPTTADFFDANGDFRSGKFDLFEGGIHVPAVAYWPGTIAAGSVSTYRTDLADFVATAAELSGAETPVGIDGTSIAAALTGEGRQRQRDYLVFEHQGSRGAGTSIATRFAVVRQDGMKLVRFADESQSLYNLNADPTESSPLNLGNQTNAQIAAELQAAAIAEGALRGVVQFRSYSGANGGNLHDDASWPGAGRPNGYWSATVANNGATPQIAHVSEDVTTLGVEVKGQSAVQVLDVHAGRTLSGRNEVRISNRGRIDLSGGTLASNRWINVRAGGELRGQGAVVGDVYNEGALAPGRPDDAQAWPVATPPALPPISLDTGVVTAAAFSFTGVQDDVPLQNTTALNQYLEVTKGLDFGPGIQPKLGNGGTDKGNEFNVMGFTGTSLTAAKNNGDYISFTVDPVAGAGAIPASVSFRVWRELASSATNYAILSSTNNFATPLVEEVYGNSGESFQPTVMATLSPGAAVTGPIEYRLYAWGATAGGSNTHINLASLSARMVAVPTLEFNFATVQDGAPLTVLSRQDANVLLTAGLNFGPGVAPRGANNVGSEFHVAGFSSGTTLQSALDGNDYLTFSVRPIAGMAMLPDSVSFNLWRESGSSATDYAVFSSVGGFASGQQLAHAQHTLVGVGNKLTLNGSIAGNQPVAGPVEFRLYGWNAATSSDSTHVIGASMRARFASVVGTPIDPTGILQVQGDFFHMEGGVIAIDLGGRISGVGTTEYDVINVQGNVELQGDLEVSLADVGGSLFAPALGDKFKILTATGSRGGQFADVTLPTLSSDLDWYVDYQPKAVQLTVFSSADFNRDGSVNDSDLALWRGGLGTATGAAKINGDANNDGAVNAADFLMWQLQFGRTAPTTAAVPEPAVVQMLPAVAALMASLTQRRRQSGSRFTSGDGR